MSSPDTTSRVPVAFHFSITLTLKMIVFLSLFLLVWTACICPVASQESQQVRQNTQCSTAILLPSTVTAERPYVQNASTTFYAPRDNAPPQVYTCPPDNYVVYDPTKIRGVRSAWYKFTPSISNYYDITPSPNIGWVSVIEGALCRANGTSSVIQTPIGCKVNSVRGVYMQAGKTYQITVFKNENYFVQALPTKPFTLAVSPTINRPINDECSNATQIPSSVSLPYTTTGVVLNATIQRYEPLPSCEVYLTKKDTTNFGGGSVWYTYTPPTTGYYNFSTVGTVTYSGPFQYVNPSQLTIAVYEGGAQICNFSNGTMPLRKEVHCTRGDLLTDRITELQAGMLYYIQVVPEYYILTVRTTLYLTINRTGAPPINDVCANAITIDPLLGVQDEPVNTLFASSDLESYPLGLTCGTTRMTDRSVWYKYVSTSPSILTTRICVEDRFSRSRNYAYIFKGTTCQTLQCVEFFGSAGCSANYFKSFVTSNEPTTYYFYLQPYSMANFTVNVQGSYFNLIHAGNDTVIAPLQPNISLSYDTFNDNPLPTTDLNIQAYFRPALNVQSSLITLIDYSGIHPKQIRRCERLLPFSVFGDQSGNYHSYPIPIGAYSVSAVPYTQADCQGPPVQGNTISNHFTVKECYNIPYVRISNQESIDLQPVMASLPCNSFLAWYVRCAFPVRKATITLFNAMTNTSIVGDSVYLSERVYFGKLSNVTAIGVTPVINKIPPSQKYRITVNIDGVVLPSFEFALNFSCTRG